MKFPTLDKLGIEVHPITRPLTEGHFPVVSAHDVERLFKGAKIGYGFGSESAGSFTYSDEQNLDGHGFAQKCLILHVEDTNVETVETMAQHLNNMMARAEAGHMPVKIEDFVAEVRKLTAKVLRE